MAPQQTFTGTLIEDQGPQYIPEGAKNNLNATFFKQDFIDDELTKDRNATAQLDLTIPFSLNDDISGFIKTGTKYRSKRRSRDKNELFTLAFTINELGAANPDKFDLTREGKIKISNFEDPNYSDDNFLGGAYKITPGLDKNLLDNFSREFASSYVKNGAMDLEDYSAGEAITAGYLMTKINIGPRLTLIPGFRYERTQNDYTSVLGDALLSENGSVSIIGRQDTLGKRAYEEFLPMVNLKVNVTPWFDVRLAATKSLSRPDYFNLVPWERISDFEETDEKGNPNLKHTRAWNYDAFFSFYGNFGLITLGAFYKSLRDIDYIRTSRITEPGRTEGYQLTEPENSNYETIVRGAELEIQTNLTFLPSPFDGIVLYANYSIIRSRTYYPLLEVGPRMTVPPFSFTFIDTVREGRMPEQPDDIANLSIGYEKGHFSGRISMIYQGERLQTIGTRKELDGYTSKFIRWDLAVSYKLLKNIGMFFNVHNLNNLPEKSFLGNQIYPTREEIFGWTSDLGVYYKF
ncbi:MAG: TonB-dependent receptor [Ignavibacteriaceae bacterium]